MIALLDRGEKAVARSIGIDGLVQEHAFEAVEQEPHGTERVRCGGQQFVCDGDEDRSPALLRKAEASAGAGRVGSG